MGFICLGYGVWMLERLLHFRIRHNLPVKYSKNYVVSCVLGFSLAILFAVFGVVAEQYK